MIKKIKDFYNKYKAYIGVDIIMYLVMIFLIALCFLYVALSS